MWRTEKWIFVATPSVDSLFSLSQTVNDDFAQRRRHEPAIDSAGAEFIQSRLCATERRNRILPGEG